MDPNVHPDHLIHPLLRQDLRATYGEDATAASALLAVGRRALSEYGFKHHVDVSTLQHLLREAVAAWSASKLVHPDHRAACSAAMNNHLLRRDFGLVERRGGLKS